MIVAVIFMHRKFGIPECGKDLPEVASSRIPRRGPFRGVLGERRGHVIGSRLVLYVR